MRVDASFNEGVTFLAVSGDVDLATADRLQEAAEMALTIACGTLRIDLSAVTFLDSTGINALIQIRNMAANTTVLILENPPPQVERILRITGLDAAFHIERNDEIVGYTA